MSDDDQYDEHERRRGRRHGRDEDGIEIPVGPVRRRHPAEAVPFGGDDDEVKRVEAALYARIGEQSPEHRLTATRRAVELLGDPHLAYPVIHVTGHERQDLDGADRPRASSARTGCAPA